MGEFAPLMYHDDKVFQCRILKELFHCLDTTLERGSNMISDSVNKYDPCELRAGWIPEYLNQSYFKKNSDPAIMF